MGQGLRKWRCQQHKMNKLHKLREPTTKFMKVRCNCKNEQIIFGKCSTVVNCLVCGKPLAHPVGGKSSVEARVLEVLD